MEWRGLNISTGLPMYVKLRNSTSCQTKIKFHYHNWYEDVVVYVHVSIIGSVESNLHTTSFNMN